MTIKNLPAVMARDHATRGATKELKKAAHSAVSAARRGGSLIPKPCERCGVAKVDAHHDDYSKPLDVRWLCRACHTRHHDEVRNPRFYARLAQLGQELVRVPGARPYVRSQTDSETG